MKRVTVGLSEELTAALQRRVVRTGLTKSEVIRRALHEELMESRRPPTVPLFSNGWGDPTLAERVDEVLAGLGDD